MSEILDRLTICESVTEWIDPYDERLVVASGEPAPNSGGRIRMDWEEQQQDWPQLATEVKRLLIPNVIAASVTAEVTHVEDMPDWNRVVLSVPSVEDWATCFPINDRTQIFVHEGRRFWAAVGLCRDILGLAVFSSEQENNNVEARVQLVPEEVFSKII